LKFLKGNPNVTELKDVFLDSDAVVMTLEYLINDLYDTMGQMQDPYTDDQIRTIMWMLVNATHQCHMNNIMHRDIKPSNIMYDSNGVIKLIDFGLARVADIPYNEETPERLLSLEIGTRWYKAPEVLLGSKTYDKTVDIWSIG